jgi:hypothetical protein
LNRRQDGDQEEGAAPKSCRDCENWPQVREKVRVGELLERIVADIEREINEDKFKATTVEYLKLIQLQKEFDQDEAREITVTWINPSENSESE